jgi:F-type H+-transporting ATPase subunit b
MRPHPPRFFRRPLPALRPAATALAVVALGAGLSAAEPAGETHGESLWTLIARVANFLILAGGLYYLLRNPLGRYLQARSEQIRSDLAAAAETRREAAARLQQVEERLRVLPSEIAALEARGREEIAAEEARIARAAEAERQRLADQTRREIERQLVAARRALAEHAADLAVGVARARLARELTPEEQMRLIDRYVVQMRTRHD